MNSGAEIIFTVAGRVGRIHLNCPERLNALSADMIVAFRERLMAWRDDPEIAAVVVTAQGERAFCAGGNLRYLYHHEDRVAGGRDFYWDGYRLFAAIQAFPKPYVALCDGINMGAGAGISLNDRNCVITERTQFAMPETGIGLFPDVGAAHFLNRCPGKTGMYLALTGARIGAGDMVALGLADAVAPSARLAELGDRLAALELPAGTDADAAINAVIAEYSQTPPPPQLAMHRPVIDRAFAGESVSAIIECLCAQDGYWAIETADTLDEKSPTSLEITHRLMGRGPSMSFEELMRTEYRLASSLVARPDFFEGIRAAVIDKDRDPKWQPSRIADVTEAEIDACFAVPESGDLRFD